MRKLTTLLFTLLFVTFAFGKSVTIEKASQVANKYFAAYSGKASYSIANSFSKSYNGITTYYVFNFTGGGFVVVSADDAAIPVLAQSNEGFIEVEISNPSTKFMFDNYSEEIAQIVESDMDNSATISDWNNILSNTIDAPLADVGPLCPWTWDQGQWYNYYCPAAAGGPGGKAWAGCVATAMGQIMKFYNFPATGVGSHTYVDPGTGSHTANFGATNYNFASMGNSATSGSYTDIATLLYHLGVSVDMGYAATGSGAYSTDVPWAMSNYFNYNGTTIKYAAKTDYTNTNWIALLKSELDANRPLYYSGSTAANEGHAWVCDGYRTSDSKFRMNWGWSGSSNGYYAVTANMVAGGSVFSKNFGIVYGIKPANANMIVRFPDLQANNSFAYGPMYNINCSVVKGTPTAVNLYIDGTLVYNTTQTTFSYPWNTSLATLGTHVFRVVALNATDTAFQEASIGLSEWISQASGFTAASRGINYIDAVDSLVAWATAYDGSGAAATINEFTKTVNGGTTWVPGQVLGGVIYGLGNICGIDANTAFVSVYGKTTQDNTCGVYKTTNGGTTWVHMVGALQGAASFADNVWFWDANIGMCHGDVTGTGTAAYFEIYTTTNGGTTWTRVPKADINGGTAALSGEGGWTSVIQAVGENTIMFGTNKANLYISHDRGLHWTVSATGITPVTDGINKISFKDDMNGLVAQTTTTVVLKETHDGGATWQTVTPTGPFLTNDVIYVPGTENTFVSTGAATGFTGASYSFDGGHSWAQFMGTETEQFLACDFVSNRCGYAGGFSTTATEKGMNKYVGVLAPVVVLNPVTNLIAQPLDNSVHLEWTEPVTPPLSYNVYRNDTLISNTTALFYHDYPVANGQQNYCVAAVYDLGESPKACAIAWITVGVPNTDEVAYRVYPNPSTEIINVVTPVKFNEVRMVNNLGQVVYRNNVQGTNLQILTEGFKPGMYILQIYTGTQMISKKVSINR
jgi:hypothetical protein